MSLFNVRFSYIDPASIRGRLIRNSGYGGPSVGVHGWTWRPEVCKSKAAKPGFHEALRESIAKDGLRNPVLVWAFSEGIFLTFGGSRVAAAIALAIPAIPAIINDYTGSFSESELVTEDNWTTFFTDIPRSFTFDADGADYHYHLERARRHEHDEAGLAWLEDHPTWLNEEFPWLTQNS